MLTNGVHGFSHSPWKPSTADTAPPDNPKPFIEALEHIGGAGTESQRRRLQMGAAARKHALETFTNNAMASHYRAAALALAPPVILVDMDGCLVDWDTGFARAWGGRSPIDRSISYCMEDCVPPAFRQQAIDVFHTDGFFLGLPAMAGGVNALPHLVARIEPHDVRALIRWTAI